MISFLLPFIRNPFPPLRTALAVSLLPAIVACTSIAPRAVENIVWDQQRELLEELGAWQLIGRVNVRYNEENDTPRIRWQQLNSEYTIRLWGTFNVGSTRIIGQPGTVSMEHDGEIFRANSPEDLILQQLGYELPVSYLEYWIRGLPAPDLNADMSFNELNQLSLMTQDGWSISYEDPRQYGELTLPREVVVARAQDDIQLTFFGLRWTLNPEIN
ncbi:MAG: outer membrane lipoprotein LolB [Pseudomonadales bacterium]|nr:outer membrane lipoprotein LolB [Pseudomonadales bacterium]